MRRELLIVAGVGAIAALAWHATARAAPRASLELASPWPALPDLDELGAELEELVGMAPGAAELYAIAQEPNVRAFLAMIRNAEGTAGRNGYRTLFGGELFDHFADHPRIAVTRSLGGAPLTSTAAGAYQFLARTWDEVRAALELGDFSPEAQDVAAVYLIRRRGALVDVRAGLFDVAVSKVSREWASLPGSPYGQPVKSLEHVRAVYADAGGSFA